MSVKVVPEQAVLNEVAETLLKHMSPSKVARFWAAWQAGSGDYLVLRQEMFGTETVATLVDKVREYEKTRTVKQE